MNRMIQPVVIVLALVISIVGNTPVSARDPEGCLTCHQYPGLAKHEKSGALRVLHIDEEKYMRSPHGKLTCKKCHTSLNKVPHTGEVKVNCNSSCHTAEKDKRIIKSYDFKQLHRAEQSYVVRLDDGSSCRACHPLYPHNENNQVRALLNMHTGFMYCEACHIKRDAFSNLSYEWNRPEHVQFAGEPFGSRFNPHPDPAMDSSHLISRIEVFESRNGAKRPLLNTWDTPGAREYMAGAETLDQETRKKRLAYFHKDIAKKAISVACDECHSTSSILDFQKLGFDEKKTRELITINIKGLVTKYKTFYFPNLFSR